MRLSSVEGKYVISGASIADGGGGPLQDSHLLIEDGRIAALLPRGSELPGVPTETVASGSVIAPGFIDVHSHADVSPFLPTPELTKIMQGVTTEVTGNCGSTLAPRHPERYHAMRDTVGKGFPEVGGDWNSFADYLEGLDASRLVTNVCPLVGHSALRIYSSGVSQREVSHTELREMQRCLENALAEGAFGLSAGLIYPPGVYSDEYELSRLAEVLGPQHTFAVHMRNEAEGLLRSIGEVGRIGANSEARMQISHLKCSGRSNWGKASEAIKLVTRIREEGCDIAYDVYPYLAASTRLTACLPPWSLEGGGEKVLARLADAETVDRIRLELLSPHVQGWESSVHNAGFDGVVIASSQTQEFEGMSLAEIARETGATPFDALIGVLRKEELRASMLEFSMSEADLETILASPLSMIGTDGAPVGLGGKPHPRLTGTYPHVLERYVRGKNTIDLPTAIWKMTGLPAATFRIPERGRILPGYVADLVCFSPEEVAPGGGYADPWAAPRGIHWVMQSGTVVVREGAWCGQSVGTRLRPTSSIG